MLPCLGLLGQKPDWNANAASLGERRAGSENELLREEEEEEEEEEVTAEAVEKRLAQRNIAQKRNMPERK